MNFFNPFPVEFEFLTEEHLALLIEKQIEEGWFVEYKKDFSRAAGGDLNIAEILKPVAAFSNAHGGWAFWGIEDAGKNKPGALVGILDTVGNLADRIAQTIHTGIVPIPNYKLKLIPLANGNSVAAIRVSEGQDAPYLTRDGIFYTRLNAESRRITDQSTLDKLFNRREKLLRQIDAFCQCKFQVSTWQDEFKTSWLELYLFPLPFASHSIKGFREEQFMEKVQDVFLKKKITIDKTTAEFAFGELPTLLNSLQTTNNGILLRQFLDAHVHNKTHSMEFLHNGNMRMFVPLDSYTLSAAETENNSKSIQYLLDRFMPYHTVKGADYYVLGTELQGDDRYERRKSDFDTYVKLLDGEHMVWALIHALTMYRQFLKLTELPENLDIGYRIRISDLWRKMIIHKHDNYAEQLEKYNVPVCQYNEIEIPVDEEPYKRFSLSAKMDITALGMASQIFTAVGIPKSGVKQVTDAFLQSTKKV
jgi:hypothetical protein